MGAGSYPASVWQTSYFRPYFLLFSLTETY